MISISDFQILPFDKKCDFITVFADYIVYRTEQDSKYYLYYMKDYFVEVCYSPSKGKVLGIHAFKNIDLADTYIDQIDISDLYL
ncbi:hypothetical protein [Fulvivirga lutimaris]|uniref:hypothetical protein n=1 Tax=Fulvivirga lutimaris TaxID=1819566 RepID=UPI0012BCFB55|nr:hypothetical protein [Fulvivirga lutimaris]MTI39225.1 hypothetical protein [Fulvivirga lutimaris]